MLLFIVFILIIISAVFSAAETAVTSVSEAKIHKLVSSGNSKAKLINSLRADSGSLIGTILIANNGVNIISSTLATGYAISHYGDNGVIISSILMTIIIILFAEIIPKTYAIHHSEGVALKTAKILDWTVKIFIPVTIFMNISVSIFFKIFGLKKYKSKHITDAVDELRGAIDLHHRDGYVVKSDKDMLGSILDLNKIDVKDIMVHRSDIFSIDSSLPTNEIIQKILNSGYTRIPLWKDNPENIVGIIHIKDLVKITNQLNTEIKDILSIASNPWFIPETTNLKTQLHEFKERRNHCAIVVDEYGALEGLITLTDIVDEIVGRTYDEHDDCNDIKVIDKNKCEVDGKTTIRDLNRIMDWELPDDNASTVAGLLIHELEKIPNQGEELVARDIRFIVLEKSSNKIVKIRLEKVAHTEH